MKQLITTTLAIVFLSICSHSQAVAQNIPKNDSIQSSNTITFEELEKRALQGDPQAQFHLGMAYYDEEVKNYEEALVWFKKAAAQGMPEAQYFLGLAYYEGDDLIRDYSNWKLMFDDYRNYKEGLKWMQKAAAQGFADAPTILKEMKKNWNYRSSTGLYILCDEGCLEKHKDKEQAELFQSIAGIAILLLIVSFIGFILWWLIRLAKKTMTRRKSNGETGL